MVCSVGAAMAPLSLFSEIETLSSVSYSLMSRCRHWRTPGGSLFQKTEDFVPLGHIIRRILTVTSHFKITTIDFV